MRAYLNYFKIRFITNLQYRAAAVAGFLTQFFFGFVYLMVYLAFYESNSGVNSPIEWSNLVTYLWLAQAFFTLTYPMSLDQELLNMIKNGNIAYEFIRPQNLFLKYYVKLVAQKMSLALLRFPLIIIIGFLLPSPFKLSLPTSGENFLLFICALIISLLLVSAFSIIMHLIVFFTIDSRGILAIGGTIADIFMGGVIPLPFFPGILKTIAYALPFRFIVDFPFRVYSNDISVVEGINLLGIACLWVIVFWLIGLGLSKIVRDKAVVQGG